MDKYIKQLEDCVTFKQLLEVVNKYDERKAKDYFTLFLPFIIAFILLYVSIILIIVFAVKKYVPQLTVTFSIMYILCGYGIYDKFFAFKIFKKARQKEINALK